MLEDCDVPQPGDGLGAQHDEESVQALNIGEQEGLGPKERHSLGVDSLGRGEEVGRQLVFLLRELVVGNVGPFAAYVPLRGEVVRRPDIADRDVNGKGLPPVRIGSYGDAMGVNNGFFVDFQAKLCRQVPARELVGTGLWYMSHVEGGKGTRRRGNKVSRKMEASEAQEKGSHKSERHPLGRRLGLGLRSALDDLAL